MRRAFYLAGLLLMMALGNGCDFTRFVCTKVKQIFDIIRQIYKKNNDLANYNQNSPISSATQSMRTPTCFGLQDLE